jgi:hypothetical protein
MHNSDKILDDLLNGGTLSVEYEKENEILEPLLTEIDLIQNNDIKNFVRSLLVKAGPFWDIPSSFSGEYHPPDERDEGGNVLHTKRVVRAATLIADSYSLEDDDRDILIAGALIHDITKGVIFELDGLPSYDPMHPYTVDRFVRMARVEDKQYGSEAQSSVLYIDEDVSQSILRLVRCHMGVWSPIPETFPYMPLEMALHIADNVAAHLHFIIDGDDAEENLWRWVPQEQE